MTLNPSAAAGLEACTPAQARIHGEEFGTECPVGSELGTVSLNVPTLPNGSLTGKVYLGGPESGPITGPPYTIYVVANSERYGVSVRLKAEVIPNEVTGQLTTVFPEKEVPEQPFTNLTMHLNRGTLTSVANPLICARYGGAAKFVPVTGTPTNEEIPFGVSITGCATTIPFSLSQSTEYETASAGAHTSYTFNLARAEGEQYLQKVKTTLPSGLVGEIPAVTLCGEPQAAQGTCGAASRIGTATVTAGSGSSPYAFSGPVYMTGPYNGAPFGLSIAVPAKAGPFNLGTVVTRSTININQTTARVTAESTLPTIVKGVPLRMRSLSVNVNRQGFLINPTNCSLEQTESVLTSTLGTAQTGLVSPLQAEGCSGLAFKPAFTASTSAKASKANGASLVTTMTQIPGQANMKSVLVTLPKALPSRLTTLQKACLAKTFEENPLNCPKVSPGSEVGTATAITPTLPVPMKGPAILVSHSGEEFPEPRARARRRRRAGDRRRQDEHQKRHHDDELRVDAGCPRIEHHRQPAAGSALGAGQGTHNHEPVHREARDAYDHHRPERQAGQTEHDHRADQLWRADRRPQGRRKHGVPDGPHIRGRAHQRQRPGSVDGTPDPGRREQSDHAQGAAVQQRAQQTASVQGEAPRRVRAQEAGRALDGDRDGDVPLAVSSVDGRRGAA